MKVAWNPDLVRKKGMFVDSTEARPHGRTTFKIAVWCVYPCVNGCAREVAYAHLRVRSCGGQRMISGLVLGDRTSHWPGAQVSPTVQQAPGVISASLLLAL